VTVKLNTSRTVRTLAALVVGTFGKPTFTVAAAAEPGLRNV
jgi:hypothetical protein